MSVRSRMPDPHQLLELRGLVARLCDAELTQAQVVRLEEMVCSDAACAAYYVNAMCVYAILPQYVGVKQGTSGVKLVSDWQSRDNEFWNDVVKIATTPDCADERVSLTRSVSEYGNPIGRDSHAPNRRTRFLAAAARFGRVFGGESDRGWLTATCVTAACIVLLLAAIRWTGNRTGVSPTDSERPVATRHVARLTKLRGVAWSNPANAPAIQSPLFTGQRLVFMAGLAEITFDSGTIAIVEGPADFEVRSGEESVLRLGRTIARVPTAARGFAIETKNVRIVDLGTEFGVEVDERQNTDVHVLSGIVEAYLPASGNAAQPLRVEANRAVRFDSVAMRIGQVPVERNRFEGIQNRLVRPVITQARPNSGKTYHIVPGGLQEDALAYTDRNYEWNGIDATGIPAELIGADYVLTSNNDDLDPNYELQITVDEPATLYVFFDKRATAPEWLTRDFTETMASLGLDTGNSPEEIAKGAGRSVDVQFSVWKRQILAGTATCGPTSQLNVAHYGVAAVAN